MSLIGFQPIHFGQTKGAFKQFLCNQIFALGFQEMMNADQEL